ncbi:MAG: ABC transporter permease [Synergistales bacterium]|nr:ABC transporter permease [Synergistales bacterium]
MGTFRYILRDTFRLLWRHWGLSILTFITAVAVFFLVGSSALFMLNTRYLVSQVEQELQITAFLDKGMDDQLSRVARQVSGFSGVVSVRTVVPEQAMMELQKRLDENAEALTILEENPLPPSVEVKVERAAMVEGIARRLLAVPEVVDVVYSGSLADKLSRLSEFATRLSASILIIAIAASALVLFNTIRIAIYSRREEISVMLLVGATTTFVALPYVLQGMLLGTLGALGATVMLGSAYHTVVRGIQQTLPFVQLIGDPVLLFRLGIVLLGGGTTVGWVSSWLAVEKFIRKALKPI